MSEQLGTMRPRRRCLFIPSRSGEGDVEVVTFEVSAHAGRASDRNEADPGVLELRGKAQAIGITPVLEVSTRSPDPLGQALSAFNLQLTTARGPRPVECVYQAGKVFEHGGPYLDLLDASPRAAKQDRRLRTSGVLLRFEVEGEVFPLVPGRAFYSWLYLSALLQARERYEPALASYAGFSDIAFGPERSLNCQAHACALFVSLVHQGELDTAMASQEAFIERLSRSEA